jgi:spore germination protein
MYGRMSRVFFPVFALLFAGAIVWGYQEHQEKNAILIKAENQYQRAFHDLTRRLGRLHDELGRTLAVSEKSDGMHRRGLINVWRLTSEAQSDISQLPLAMMPLNKAEQFLARLSEFAYHTAVRDLKKQPLTEDEIKTLKSLYEASAEIGGELNQLQNDVIRQRLRWMDVEVALATEKEPYDSTIIDGFRTLDRKAGSYPDGNWSPSVLSAERKRSENSLSGMPVTAEDAAEKAREFLRKAGLDSLAGGEMRVEEYGAGTELPGFAVAVDEGGGSQARFDFTRKGGHLLRYVRLREQGEPQIGLREAQEKAARFLERTGLGGMTPVSSDEYGRVASFVFSAVQDGVRIYPDKVTVRVALDNGEVVGLLAADHVFAPAEAREVAARQARIGQEEARRGLNGGFRMEEHHMGVIENEVHELVLCHVFTGQIHGSAYRIFINAETGIEESVERLPDRQENGAGG